MKSTDSALWRSLEPEAQAVIAGLAPGHVAKGTVLFRPGEAPPGFLMVLSGRVGVYLIGQSGRDMLLYDVLPGQTCIQTTLCLLGEQVYSGEGVAETDVGYVMLSRSQFAALMDRSPRFRAYIFRAFGDRLQEIVMVLEKVSFVKIEARLAGEILHRAGDGTTIEVTHQELATAIGSVREVVSRRLETFKRSGLVRLDRGQITILDAGGLWHLADERA